MKKQTHNWPTWMITTVKLLNSGPWTTSILLFTLTNRKHSSLILLVLQFLPIHLMNLEVIHLTKTGLQEDSILDFLIGRVIRFSDQIISNPLKKKLNIF